MSFTDDFLKGLEKRNVSIDSTSKGSNDYTTEFLEGVQKRKKKKKEDIDLAPVRSTVNSSITNTFSAPTMNTITDVPVAKERTWFKAGAFSDGSWDGGDLTKTILGTAGDFSLGVLSGVGNFAEGVGDLVNYGIAGAADLLGADDFAKSLKEETQKNVVDKLLGDTIKKVGKNSIIGDKGDSVAEGIGYMLPMIATGGVLGSAELGASGVTAATTAMMGTSGMGSGMSEAYQSGATDGEAITYGAISAASEVLSEKLFGGLGKTVKATGFNVGLSRADDMLAKKVSNMFSSQITKNLAEYGIKAGAEGFEEFISGIAQAGGKKLTYMSEEDIGKILQDENLLEQFVTGAVTSGFMQAGDVHRANKTGTDFITNLTENEQKVVDKEVENRIAEKEENGEKVTKKDKSKIYDKVLEDLDKGYISIDTIESVLGGDTYKAYKDTIDKEDALIKGFEELGKRTNATLEEQDRYAELKKQVQELKSKSQRSQLKSQLGDEVFNLAKGSRLVESYNERDRVYQDFQADYSKIKGAKYEDAAKKTLENAIKSGANNTNRVRDLVEMNAKISGDTGIVFEYKGNEQLKNDFIERQTREISKIENIPEAERTEAQNNLLTELKDTLEKVKSGKITVNGDITSDGIVINLDSPKALNSLTGHEITHSLEKSKHYNELRDTLFAYAKAKGVDIDSELAVIKSKYQGVANANPEAELVADLVGDYLFTDADFINNLSTEKPNVFKRIYNEIKYLCKVATAGSKEARELEKVKRAFDKAYKESGKAKGDTKYSLTAEQENYFKDSKVRDENGDLKVMYHGTSNGGHTVFDTFGESKFGLFGAGTYFTDNKDIAESYTEKGRGNNKQVYESYLNITNPIDMDAKADVDAWKNAFSDADYSNCVTNEDCFKAMKEVFVDEQYPQWEAKDTAMDVLQSMGYDGITHIGGGRFNKADDTRHRVYIAFEPEQIKNIDNIAPTTNPDIRYSLSDSEGRELSTEQKEYFKDSKIRDENGNLRVMWHGTSSNFTVFDIERAGQNWGGNSRLGKGFYFTDTEQDALRWTEGTKTVKAYLNIINPLDVDATIPKNIANEIDKYIDNRLASFDESNSFITKEQYIENLQRIKEMYMKDVSLFINEFKYDDNGKMTDGIREFLSALGYDGIVSKNETVAFYPEQIKLTTNENPTQDADIRYSLSETDNTYLSAVENGDTETAQKMVDEVAEKSMPNSIIRDENGKLLTVYHGSSSKFTVFNHNKMNANGNAHGRGFYFTEEKSLAEGYQKEGGQLLKGYLNITNPMSEEKVTIKKPKLVKLIKAICEEEAKNLVAEEGYESVREALPDTWISGYVYTYGMNINDAYKEVADIIYSNDNDVDIIAELTNVTDTETVLKKAYEVLGKDGVIYTNERGTHEYVSLISEQFKSAEAVTYDDNGNVIPLSQRFNEGNNDIRYSLTEQETQETNEKLNKIGYNYDAKSKTISYSLSSLEDAFNYKTDKNGLLVDEDDYLKARNEYVDALAKSIAVEKGKPTREEYKKADRYLDSLFLVHDMIAEDKNRLDYEAAVNRSAWVGNVEYGGSIDFSTLCAKRRLFTGTFDAIQNELPDTVLTDKDFLNIRNLLLEHGEESPCSMCYVEGSRAKHGVYVDKWLKEYLKTNPEWKPQIADFTSTTRLEQTRIQHPEAYAEYVKAMNKLSQRKPKEASVRTDYKGEILDAFSNDSSVETKNKNGGIRFNSFSDFEIIHALDCMQVLTDMARVGLNGQAYTKVKEFAESFGNTGLKINLSLVAKDVDANGKLVMDETNGMNYAEAMDIRNRYSDNVGTVIVVFNDEQLKAALADNTIDYVLPFHRSQWRKSQYALMGLPKVTRDYTNIQNDRYKNPKTGRPKKAPNGNIMPNEYWDFTLSGRENAQRYLDYINENSYIPKFDFLLDKVDGKWVLPNGAVGDGYFKLLIDFKMYNNKGIGSPQKPVLPEFNMPYIQQMLKNYVGGHQAFPVAHDVVDKFVEGKKNGTYSLSEEGETFKKYGNFNVYGKDFKVQTEDIAPTKEFEAIKPKPEKLSAEEEQWAKNKMARADKVNTEQPTAKILTEEPKADKKKSPLWSKIKTNFIDKATPFETLSLKTGNREVDAKFNSIRYSDSKAQMLIGEGAEGVKALNDIIAEVENDGLTQSLNEYLYHKHNVDRMTLADRYADVPNKAVFGDNVTAEVSQDIVNQYEFAEPKLKEYAEDIYTYNKHLRNLLVDGGVISQETADLWEEMYPHYVPIRRVDDSGFNINVPLDSGRTGINAPIKKATGGNTDILPLFDTMAQRTLQTYKAIAKNRFGVELKNTLGTTIENTETSIDEVIESLDTQDSLLQEGKNGKNPTFTVFENGEKVTFEITDEMYDALKPTSEGLAYTNKVANTVSNAMRGVLTKYNPTFMLTNAIKDAQDVLINSQHARKTYKNFPKAIKELASKGKWYTEYIQNGGADNTYFDKETNTFNKEKSKLSKVAGFPFEKISSANNFIERIPRLAEYIASREMGRSIDVSMLDSARVTTNFAAGGDVTKFLNRNGATFLNASVQGAVQQVRNIREAKANGLKGWVQLATKVALAGLPAMLLNGLLWDDDEEYEELSDYVKENYYVVAKTKDGKFVRIPKGRTLAVIQSAFEQVQNALTGDDEVDLQRFLELAVSNLAPNNPLDNNIIAPIKQVMDNKTWYGEDLVPTRLQDVPNAEQYDESTDAISKWLGEKLNVNPYKFNYLLNQYSGGVGDVFLPMLTPEAESGDNSLLGNFMAPLKDKFTTDSVLNNQNTSDFYNVSDKLKVNANSSNATDEDILKNKYFNSVSTEIGELYKEKREIQNSNLSDDVKFKQVRAIQEQINEITENALNTYENVKINGKYANIGDRHYRLNDDGEWQKITDEQLEKQNEVIDILGITPSQYWGNKKEYDMKAFYPEKYAVLQEQGISVEDYKENYEESAFIYTDDYSWAADNPGKYTLSKAITSDVAEYKQYTSDLYNIKADKDSSGKSISGSRKEKVIDYINELDIDYGAKCILIKSEYESEDRYNNDIVDYLNNRDDISAEEMITILEELGATIDEDGNIYW